MRRGRGKERLSYNKSVGLTEKAKKAASENQPDREPLFHKTPRGGAAREVLLWEVRLAMNSTHL